MEDSIQIWEAALGVSYPGTPNIEINALDRSELVLSGLNDGLTIEIAKDGSGETILLQEAPEVRIEFALESNEIDITLDGTILYHPTNTYLPQVKQYLGNENDLTEIFIGGRRLSDTALAGHDHDEWYAPINHSHNYAPLDHTHSEGDISSYFILMNEGTADAYLRSVLPISSDGDIQAYGNFGQFPPDIWESLPTASHNAKGAIMYDGNQFETTVAGVFRLKDGVLAPGGHTHAWSDIASGVPSSFTPSQHNLVSATHQVSGLTTGHFLRANASNSYVFSALTFADVKAVITDWFELVNEGQAGEYLRLKKPLAADYDIQAYSNSGQFPSSIFDDLPLASDIAKGAIQYNNTQFETTNGIFWIKPGVVSAASHNHDDRYYTETEVDTFLAGKAALSHNHDSVYEPLIPSKSVGYLKYTSSDWSFVNETYLTTLGNGMLSWDGSKYVPYDQSNKAAGRFYTFTSTYPTNSTGLAWDGYLYATRMYFGNAFTYLYASYARIGNAYISEASSILTISADRIFQLKANGTYPLHLSTNGAYRLSVDGTTGIVNIVNGLNVNSISEYTAANGVLIDGVLLKDDALNLRYAGSNYWTVQSDGSPFKLLFKNASGSNVAELDQNGNLFCYGEVAAFASSTAPPNWWDNMPVPTTTTRGGILLYDAADTTHYLRGDGTWQVVTSGISYPGAGIAVSTGSAWGTSITPSTGYLYYNGSTYSWATPSGSSQWTNNTGGIYYASKVSIGVNSEGKTKLHVFSDVSSDTQVLGTASGGFSLSNSWNAYGLNMGVLSTGDSWIQAHRFDGTATAYNLILQRLGGNVGIGTASPSPKLMVDSVADTQHGLYVKRTTSTSDYWCGVFYNSATGIEADLAGKTYSAIFNGGNVGIGTSNPTPHYAGRALIIDGTSASTRGMLELWDQAGGKSCMQSVSGTTYLGSLAKGSGTGDVAFTYGAGTIGMTMLGSNGNVGIGEPNPWAKLHVTGTVMSNNNGNNCFALNSSGANYGFISNSAANEWFLGYGTSLGTLGTAALKWNSSSQVAIAGNPTSAKLTIGSGSGQQYNILVESYYTSGFAQYCGNWASSGRWGIGPATASSDNTIRIGNISDSVGTWAGTQNINLIVGGEVTAYYSSDRFLKQNIHQFSALEKIDRINNYAYQWNAKAKELNSSKDDRTNYGWIAQELEPVMPELIHKIYGEYKSVDYVQGVPIAFQGIKELHEKIKSQDRKIQELENTIRTMKNGS